MDEAKKTVLIVDDDTQFSKDFAEKIQAVGLNAQIAITPKEALDYITNNKVDFIVLDFVMPEMDGSAVNNLISHDLRKTIPTIILTNFPNTKNIPQDLEVYVKLETDLSTLAQTIKTRLAQI